MGKKYLHIILWTGLVGLWLVPLLQPYFMFWEEKPLGGAVSTSEMPQFSTDAWHDNTYQQQAEAALGDNFGLRTRFVRLRNQLKFDLYGDISARGVVLGREGYLYEQNYLDAYYGEDFAGVENIQEQVLELKAIQDSLAARGKVFLFVLASGKASFFPEYLPDATRPASDSTNYLFYRAYADSLGLNLIDVQSWFLQMKDTSHYPLYPKTGIHWSNYGAALVMDSLLGYLEQKLDTSLARQVWGEIRMVSEPQNPDMDIEEGMNLWYPLDKYQTADPALEYDTAGVFLPRVLTIADSYYWQFLGRWMAQLAFTRPAFWYYYKEYYEHGYPGARNNLQVNLPEVLDAHDVVILMSTEGTLKGAGWGFVNDAHSVVMGNWDPNTERLRAIRQHIRNDAQWFEQIQQKAQDWGVSVDSAVNRDAIFALENGFML